MEQEGIEFAACARCLGMMQDCTWLLDRSALDVHFEDVPLKLHPLDGCEQGAPGRACIMISLVDEAQVGSHGSITGAACSSFLETLSIEMGLLTMTLNIPWAEDC